MKNLSPNNLALICGGVIALVVFSGLAGLTLAGLIAGKYYVWLLVSAISFLISFVTVRYILHEFLFEKVRVIYKNIHELKSTRELTETKINMNRDVLREVDQEVAQWAEERKNEIEQLRSQEEYRREYIGNVSHEIKTPIFNIQGYISTLLEGGLEDPSINRDYLQRASRSVDRMISIVEDLETITQLEANELKLDMDRFDVVQLAQEVFRGQEVRASAQHIQLTFNQPYDKPVWVFGDKDRIRQVFTNLVVNSIKYGKQGGTTQVRFYDMDENILVEVADNGSGIAKQHLPRLFERFYRVDKGRSRDSGGTGLGLSIVKHIIEAHHQTINVRSTEGVGSTFSFTLKKG